MQPSLCSHDWLDHNIGPELTEIQLPRLLSAGIKDLCYCIRLVFMDGNLIYPQKYYALIKYPLLSSPKKNKQTKLMFLRFESPAQQNMTAFGDRVCNQVTKQKCWHQNGSMSVYCPCKKSRLDIQWETTGDVCTEGWI